MSKKKNIVSINLDEWTTMAKKAKSLGLTESTIRKRVERTRKGTATEKPEVIREIPELDLVLVKKAGSVK